MKLSELIEKLFTASEFTSINSLAYATDQTQPFTDAFVNSTKASREKEDALFHALTSDVSVDEVLAAVELIRFDVSVDEVLAAIELIRSIRANQNKYQIKLKNQEIMNLYVNNTNGISGLPVTIDNVGMVFDKLVRRTYERGGRTIKENPSISLVELSDNTVWWIEDNEGNQSEGGSGIPSKDQLENEVRIFSSLR